jgi:hypothetical protein
MRGWDLRVWDLRVRNYGREEIEDKENLIISIRDKCFLNLIV